MILPVTWEENIAANMSKIPALELFPGVMVSDLYKAYRAGLEAGKYPAWNGSDPGDLTVGYIADTTGKRADIVRDFLDAMLKTVSQGKAPAGILTGEQETGIAEKAGGLVESIENKAGEVLKTVSGPLVPVAIISVSLVALYLLAGGFVPRPRRAA